MKFSFLIFVYCCFSCFSKCVANDVVELFRCISHEYKISPYALSRPLEGGAKSVILTTYSLGEKLGAVSLSEIKLEKLHEKAIEYNQSNEPFFGNGEKFLIREGCNYYVLFYESDKRSKLTDGKRCGIGKLVKFNKKNLIFIGSPYDGITFNLHLLKQLELVTKQTKGEKKKR